MWNAMLFPGNKQLKGSLESVMRRLVLVSAVAAAVVIELLPGTAMASNRGQYLCIASSLPAQCADLANFTASETLIMENSRTPYGAGLGWNASYTGNNVGNNSPFSSGSGLNTRYNGDPIYMIEKTTATGHNGCIWANGVFKAVWNACSSGDNADLWVKSDSNYWINIGESNAQYLMSGQANTPYGLSDTQNGSSDGSDINVWKTDNRWFFDTP